MLELSTFVDIPEGVCIYKLNLSFLFSENVEDELVCIFNINLRILEYFINLYQGFCHPFVLYQ